MHGDGWIGREVEEWMDRELEEQKNGSEGLMMDGSVEERMDRRTGRTAKWMSEEKRTEWQIDEWLNGEKDR